MCRGAGGGRSICGAGVGWFLVAVGVVTVVRLDRGVVVVLAAVVVMMMAGGGTSRRGGGLRRGLPARCAGGWAAASGSGRCLAERGGRRGLSRAGGRCGGRPGGAARAGGGGRG